jgi:GNAT superfamily N-acetyltransferase
MKLLKKLRGKNVQISHGLAQTLAEIDALPDDVREEYTGFRATSSKCTDAKRVDSCRRSCFSRIERRQWAHHVAASPKPAGSKKRMKRTSFPVEVALEFRLACLEDVDTYAALGRIAQEWLTSRGLSQYVPSAHDEYADAIRARIESGTLYSVSSNGSRIAFFSLDPVASQWWPVDTAASLYLAGMVVAREAKGRGIGGEIIRWCVAETARRSCDFLRLDCHAGNPWLCAYYESHGFTLQGHVLQHPGYIGRLYQRAVERSA